MELNLLIKTNEQTRRGCDAENKKLRFHIMFVQMMRVAFRLTRICRQNACIEADIRL